jgi:hypothetical protein
MSTLIDIFDTVKADAENDLAKATRFTQEHLPVIAETVQALAANPLAQAAMKVAHLSPEFLAVLAQQVEKADADLGAAKDAQAAADQAAKDALAAAIPPASDADPEPEQPAA